MGQVAVVVSGSFASRGKVFADMSRAKLAEEEGGREGGMGLVGFCWLSLRVECVYGCM